MATEATITVPSDQFPLGTLFQQLPDAKIELERVVPANDRIIPYFWVRGILVDDLESEFSEHPGVERIALMDSVQDEYLLRVEWGLEYDDVMTVLAEIGIPLIKASGTNQQWTFEIRGDDHKDIAAFQSRCRELDIQTTLTNLSTLTPLETDSVTKLTDTQRDALVLAHDRGYFESPRKVTMEDLGEELGISQQAVASRLRRGINRILERTLSEVSTDS